MWAHILISKGMYDVVISKGDSHIYVYKKVAPHIIPIKWAHVVNPINMGPVF